MQCLDILSSHLLFNNWRKQVVMKISSRGFWLRCLSHVHDVRLCGNEKQNFDYIKEIIILNNIHNYCSYKLWKYIHLSNCVTRTMSEWPMKLRSQKEEGDHTNSNHFWFLLCMQYRSSFLSCFLSCSYIYSQRFSLFVFSYSGGYFRAKMESLTFSKIKILAYTN